ncbi:hypothetical protein [Actinoplanes sp. TFC3]|uniref:hypothetical protein n=1 Tax=Actinoplanes sp. TFC3 TaxID=1710355 RepID=UPI0012907EC1|nr:hypothetical protein [Actinoplanes sp. TFC3]
MLLVAGVAVALAAAGSGMAAYGGWNVDSSSPTFTVHAARIPQMLPPAAAPGPKGQVITWEKVAFAQTYVITRHVGALSQTACTVRAKLTHCTDHAAPTGQSLTYTVAARYGTHWAGLDSSPSSPVIIPGAAVVALPSVAPTISRPPSAIPVAPSATPPSPSPSPSSASPTPRHHHHHEPEVTLEPSATGTNIDGRGAGDSDSAQHASFQEFEKLSVM